MCRPYENATIKDTSSKKKRNKKNEKRKSYCNSNGGCIIVRCPTHGFATVPLPEKHGFARA